MTIELYVEGRPYWMNVRNSKAQRPLIRLRDGTLVPVLPTYAVRCERAYCRRWERAGGQPPNHKLQCRAEGRRRIDQLHCQFLALVHYAAGDLSDADMMEIGDALSHAELVGFVHCRALRQIVRVQICKYFFQDIMHQ